MCKRQHENIEDVTYFLLLIVNLYDKQHQSSLSMTQCAHRIRAVLMGGARERSRV